MPNLNVPTSTTITFDEHITKVSWLGWTSQGDTQIYEATTSGQNIDWFYPDDGSYYVITFTITLDKNYILNDVNVNSISGGVPIKDKTNNTFQINLRDDSGTYDPSTITLTSKLEGVSDTKPVYKFINNAWVKQDAFQFTNGSWVRISTATTPLATPVISLSENILKIKRVDNATSYDVYVDNVLKKTVDVPKSYTLTIPASGTVQSGTSYNSYYNSYGGHGGGKVDVTLLDGSTKVYKCSTESEQQVQNVVRIDNIWLNGAGSSYYTDVNGQGYEINGFPEPLPYTLTQDSVVCTYVMCFVRGTQITLANGTTKNVEDITYDDELLVWNFYEGKYDIAKPSWIMIPRKASEYKLVTFSDNSILKLAGPDVKSHRLYNVTKQQFLYANECVGDKVFTQRGILEVTGYEIVQEEVEYYNLTTEKYYDCFANGVLAGSRLNNMYHINTDMKYDSDIRLISEKEEKERWEVREQCRLEKARIE